MVFNQYPNAQNQELLGVTYGAFIFSIISVLFGYYNIQLNTRIVVCLQYQCTGLFITPSGISELDCATIKTDTAERSISIGRESLQVFFVLGALGYFQIPPLGGSRDEKWRSK